MSLLATPSGLRLQIGVFGRRNVGKSSTLNALTRQGTSIVSATPGTTTDPVSKAMELSPLGPVLLIDTAGLDDVGELGASRVDRTRAVLRRVDVAVIVVDATRDDWLSEHESALLDECSSRAVPCLVVVNESDVAESSSVAQIETTLASRGIASVVFSAARSQTLGAGAPELRAALTQLAPESFLAPPPLVSDLVAPGDFVVLVTPIDKEAPKGRLILPQVQAIRDLLDGGCGCVVVQEPNLRAALSRLSPAPKLVVTDSQAFRSVASLVPESISLTSFSILFARQKGDFRTFYAGALALAGLTGASRVLIAESCAHHPIEEDIGTVKIPRMLRARFGETLRVDHVQGCDFPSRDELRGFDLIIHCGACMTNRREVLSRQAQATSAGVPITNYGMTIAFLTGVLSRAVQPLGIDVRESLK